MVTQYHRTVQAEIIAYGKELAANKRIRKVYEGNKRPLSLVDPRSKAVMNYQPDVYFVCRNNKKRIIEILDSEEKKQDIIIADIIRSMLVENVDALMFIYPGNGKDEQIILAALKTMYKGMVDLGVRLEDLPNDQRTAPYRITREEAKDSKTLREKLVKHFGDLNGTRR